MKRRSFFQRVLGLAGLGAVKASAATHKLDKEVDEGWLVAWNDQSAVACGLVTAHRESSGWVRYDPVIKGSCGQTDNPAWFGRIQTGKNRNHVFIGGVEVSDLRITALRTGPNGWVEYIIPDETSQSGYVMEGLGDIKRFIKRGRVEFKADYL